MKPESSPSIDLQACLGRMRAGDAQARDELFRHAGDRLERLARKMLKGFPGVRRWAQTDDVLQNALVRLLRALKAVQPSTVREFFCLSTEQIRRELIDMARHYYGPQGVGANHHSNGQASSSDEPRNLSNEPVLLAAWAEFHEQVRGLPSEEREVIDLLFYQELPQSEAAALIGVTVRTVQRRWQAALVKLHEILKGHWPGL